MAPVIQSCTCNITIASFLERKLCQACKNLLIICCMFMTNGKKLSFLADSKEESYFQKSMKNPSNLVRIEEENRLFYINKKLSKPVGKPKRKT